MYDDFLEIKVATFDSFDEAPGEVVTAGREGGVPVRAEPQVRLLLILWRDVRSFIICAHISCAIRSEALWPCGILKGSAVWLNILKKFCRKSFCSPHKLSRLVLNPLMICKARERTREGDWDYYYDCNSLTTIPMSHTLVQSTQRLQQYYKL